MGHYHPFAASNKPGTCCWCGRKLRQQRYVDDPTKRGDYGDGFFCGLRCAYLFAVWFARQGRRIK